MEIQRACDLANLSQKSTNQNEYAAVTIQQPPGQLYPYYHHHSFQPNLFFKVKEFFNLAALIGATTYCVYWFYKVKMYKFFYLQIVNNLFEIENFFFFLEIHCTFVVRT